MQTFLPYPSFTQSAAVLDQRRLGKQRVEVLQILKTLAGESEGWKNHPAVKMWRGYENALVVYGVLICNEWINRGFKDTCLLKISSYANKFESLRFPTWMYDERFHLSHQSNLIRKYPEYYQTKFGENVPNNLDYVWPVA